MAFHPMDRETDYLLPPSVQEWLPEAHLARYVVDVVEGLELSALERASAGRGSAAYHPATLRALLIYGYATGTFSSRKSERATHDSLAFRYTACNRHPDHDTRASFRRRFGKEFEAAFRTGAPGCAGESTLPFWQRQSGWRPDPRQRQPAPRALVCARREDRSASERRSAGIVGAGERAADPSSILEGVNLPDDITWRAESAGHLARRHGVF